MRSEDLLTLLRGWLEGRSAARRHASRRLAVPGTAREPISTRQLYRIVVDAARAADIAKRVGPHTLRHSLAPTCWRTAPTPDHQVLLGHAKLNNTALYAKVATRTVRTVTSPLDKLGLFRPTEISPDG